MARFVAVVLLLTLALAPAASATPPSRGESPAAGWLTAFQGALDWFFSRVPLLRAEPQRSGAWIDPSGVQAEPREHGAYIDPSGLQAAPRKHGAYIDPSGVRAVPDPHGKPKLRERVARRPSD